MRDVLVAESCGFSPQAAEILARVGEPRLLDLDRRGLLAEVRSADVLWVRLRNRIDAEVFAQAKRLKILVSPTTGLNHIDLEEAARRGVTVLSLRGETEFLRGVRATAEQTLALMLALLRRLPAAAAHVNAGGWNRDLFVGSELAGKTVGLVGYGRLGRLVARLLLAFGARVLASDPAATASGLEPGVALVPLPSLLAESDIVSLHVALTDQTRGLFGAEQVFAMRKGALFVNTARGELVDEAALLAGLESGHLGGAALDVLADERPRGMGERPLVRYARAHDDVIVTPHVGGCTKESMEKTEVFLAQRLADHFAGHAELVAAGRLEGAA